MVRHFFLVMRGREVGTARACGTRDHHSVRALGRKGKREATKNYGVNGKRRLVGRRRGGVNYGDVWLRLCPDVFRCPRAESEN